MGFHLVVTFLLLLVLSSPVSANSTVVIEGGIVQDNRTLVPLRGIFEELGATVTWNAETKVVKAVRGKDEIILTVGSKHTNVNGRNTVIDVPAQVFDGRTFVPLRFVSESLGASVNWDPVKMVAGISSNDKQMSVNVSKVTSTSGKTSVIYRNDQMGFLFLLDEKLSKSFSIKEGTFKESYLNQRDVQTVDFYYKDKTYQKRDVWSLAIVKYTVSEWNNYYSGSNQWSLSEQGGWVYAISQPGEHPYMFGGFNSNHNEAHQYLDTHYKLVEAIESTVKFY